MNKRHYFVLVVICSLLMIFACSNPTREPLEVNEQKAVDFLSSKTLEELTGLEYQQWLVDCKEKYSKE